MCYYNGQKVTRAEYIELKGLAKEVRKYNFLNVGVHNGFQYLPCAILVQSEDGKDFDIIQAEWGYVPGFLKTRAEANAFRLKYTTLNFKAENLFVKDDGERSMWADAAKARRCLVLSTGIVESRHMPKFGKKGQLLKATEKIPYNISVKGREYFYMPGLYNEWFDTETGTWANTVAFGIVPANHVMRQIHNSKLRMPSILTEDLAYEWLMTQPSQERLLEIAMTRTPSATLEFCTIDKNYRTEKDAIKKAYPEVPDIDMVFTDQEDLLIEQLPVSETNKELSFFPGMSLEQQAAKSTEQLSLF